ncbi:MAG: class I SAM-dependent methyltransferase [Oscillospiraceae bacterium]|nr:class I SAM-dependent methyltransferase [Oscillospiraceae bacterium]
MSEVDIVEKFYDENSEKEWNRLSGFRYEFEITKTMMKKHMNKGKVLDIGGGPGRYSLYLASIGYDVTLVDLSKNNIEFAKNKSREMGLSIKAYQCDARHLEKLDLGEYDNILIMGPFYHLFEASDRKKVLLDSLRHLSENGKIFASFISIFGGFNYYFSECPHELINEPEKSFFDSAANDESWAGSAFTQAYFIDADEIEDFFNGCGLKKTTIFGQEGIAAPRLMDLEDLEKTPEDARDYWLEISLKLCENKKYFPYSSHIMYIGERAQRK